MLNGLKSWTILANGMLNSYGNSVKFYDVLSMFMIVCTCGMHLVLRILPLKHVSK